MHAKLTVIDDMVFTGSYNLSRSGEQNAENVLEIEDAALAERLAAFVDEVRARYPRYTASRGQPRKDSRGQTPLVKRALCARDGSSRPGRNRAGSAGELWMRSSRYLGRGLTPAQVATATRTPIKQDRPEDQQHRA